MNRKTEISERVLALIKAARDGDEDSVFQWLRGCRNEIDTCDDTHDKYNALHYAAEKGHLGVLKMLLLAGADVNYRSGDRIEDEGEITFQPGHTPLILAARYSRPEAAELLLSANADPHIRSEQSWTALHAAAVGGNLAVVENLLSMKVDHSVMSYGRHFDEELGWYFFNTPMHAAAANGKSDIVACLLKHDRPLVETIVGPENGQAGAGLAHGNRPVDRRGATVPRAKRRMVLKRTVFRRITHRLGHKQQNICHHAHVSVE